MRIKRLNRTLYRPGKYLESTRRSKEGFLHLELSFAYFLSEIEVRPLRIQWLEIKLLLALYKDLVKFEDQSDALKEVSLILNLVSLIFYREVKPIYP